MTTALSQRIETHRLLGVLLLLHGLAHALPGIRAMDRASGWLGPDAIRGGRFAALWIALVCATAVGVLVAAGFGALGVRAFRRHWIGLALIGAIASLLLLVPWWPPFAIWGVLIDVGLIATLWHVVPSQVTPARRLGAFRIAGNAACVLAVAYLSIVVLARPWYMRWGATETELHVPLPGDELQARHPVTYAMNHAVTIRAPVSAVWPWLAQLGQDRGGFYSYDWLENLFGLKLRNADRIHPEWPAPVAGDSVFATPPGWLGFHRRFGWEVERADANRLLFLRNWGAFVLVPIDSVTTRFIVRTRGGGPERFLFVPLGWMNLWVFEPAHFIMQHRMLRGIQARAESFRSG